MKNDKMTEKASTENSAMEAEDKLKKTWVQEIDFTTQKQLETEKQKTGSVFSLNECHKWTLDWLTYETSVFKSLCRFANLSCAMEFSVLG